LGKSLNESQALSGGGGEEKIPCLCRESDPGISARSLGHYAEWDIRTSYEYRNAFSGFVIWWTEITVLRVPRRYLCAVCMYYLQSWLQFIFQPKDGVSNLYCEGPQRYCGLVRGPHM